MTAYLFDVSAIIALLDRKHVSHEVTNEWFAANASTGWATCPIVQNGVVRIMCQPAYPNMQDYPAIVAAALQRLCKLAGHAFWPDKISLLASDLFDLDRLPSARHLTDTYLLALAVSHGGKLATLDRRLSAAAVRNGSQHLQFIA